MTAVPTSTSRDRGTSAAGSSISVAAFLQGFRPVVGGAQLQYERLLPRLRARGAEIEVITRAHADVPRRELLDGAKIRRTLVGGTSPVASADYILECAAHLTRRRRSVDLVHAHGALSEGAAALWGTVLGLPVLVKILRTGPEGDLQTLDRRPAGPQRLNLLAERAWFAAVSAEARAEIESRGVPPTRIFDIPNGVDTGTFRPADGHEKRRLRDQLGLPAETLIVYTGRLESVKRIEILVRAMSDVPTAALVIVGDGPERRGLEELVVELELGGRVRFAGNRANVADYLRAADVFATPSDSEGLSNALLEAMAAGLACLAARASAVRELLADERGVLVDSGDPRQWSRALNEMVAGRALADHLGRRAAHHVASTLTLENTADRLMSAYRQIVAAGGEHGARTDVRPEPA